MYIYVCIHTRIQHHFPTTITITARTTTTTTTTTAKNKFTLDHDRYGLSVVRAVVCCARISLTIYSFVFLVCTFTEPHTRNIALWCVFVYFYISTGINYKRSSTTRTRLWLSPFVTCRDDLFLSIVAIQFTVNNFFGVRDQVTERNVAGRVTLVIQQREYSRKFVGRCACSRYFIAGTRTEKKTNLIECRERVKRHVDVTNRDIHVGWVRSVSHFRRIYARFTNKILPSRNMRHEARSSRCDSANLFSLPAILVVRVWLAPSTFENWSVTGHIFISKNILTAYWITDRTRHDGQGNRIG